MAGGRGKYYMDGGEMPNEADVRMVSSSPPAPKSYHFDKGEIRECNDIYCFQDGSRGHIVPRSSDQKGN